MTLFSRLSTLFRRGGDPECTRLGHEWAAYGDPALQRPHGINTVGGGYQPNAGFRRRCTRCGALV